MLVRTASPRHETISVTTDIKTVVTANVVRAGRCPRMTSILLLYFLFIGGSSMKLPQRPVGFTWVAFLTILIFIVLSYDALAASCASEMTADSKLRL